MTKESLVAILQAHQAEAFSPTAEGAADRILAALAAEESLPVLADRKGWWIMNIHPPCDTLPVDEEWVVWLETEGLDEMGCARSNCFFGKTYARAEELARIFLNTLPDYKREL